jgi:hypothetical protein
MKGLGNGQCVAFRIPHHLISDHSLNGETFTLLTTTVNTPATNVADTIVTRMAAIYPELGSIENVGVQKMVAMTLVSYQAMQIEGDDLFERAKSEVMGMYVESDNAAKMLADEKAKATTKAFDDLISAARPSLETLVMSVPTAYRPTVGYRILAYYNTAPIDPKSGDIQNNAEGNALEPVPFTFQIVPLNVKKVGGQSSGTGTGGGRTIGVFKVIGTDDVVQLGALAKSKGRADNANETPRKFLENLGYTIANDATDGVKWITPPTANNGTAPTSGK